MSELKFSTWLATDAMYFHAARRSLKQAQALHPEIDRAHLALQAPQSTGDSRDEQSLSKIYGPFLEALAVVHVMAASSLEAHINYNAHEVLSNSDFADFDELTLEGKWKFFPLLLRCSSGFDSGAEPFQGFTQLIKRRNRLIHYKPKFDPSAFGGPPKFLDSDGLTLEASEKSINTTEAMMRKLAEIRDVRAPYWLDNSAYEAFNWSIEGLFSIEEST